MITVVILIFAIVLHEVAHGLAAYALGDPTAKQAGRLTLNPLKHIDPFWTLILPAILLISTQGRFAIGMAKPVPVNFFRLRNPKKDMVWVGLAGPAANIALAALFSGLLNLTGMVAFLYGVYINLGLALFNMIPIPPLDGSRVAAGLMPVRWLRYYLGLERFGFLIILILYMKGWLFWFIRPGMDFFCRLFGVPGLFI